MKNLKLFEPTGTKEKTFLRLPLWTFLGMLFFFSSCTVSLAPKYDQGIVDNLSASTTQVFQLIAAVSSGTTKEGFAGREQNYNNIIGTLEALKLEINARPVPQNKIIDKVISKANDRLKQNGEGTLISAGDVAPSASALEQVVNNLTKMKETDKAQGLTALEVKVFKGNIILYFDQALTYEKFLNQ